VVAVAALGEFLERFVRRPVLLEDAIHRAHEAGAIRAVLAVDEERPVLRVPQHPHHFDDVIVIDTPGENLRTLRAQ